MEEKFLDMVGHEGALTAPKGGGTKLMDVAHLYQDFMEHGSVCLHIVDKQGVILWANNSELATLGYSQDEYIGRSIRDFHIDLGKEMQRCETPRTPWKLPLTFLLLLFLLIQQRKSTTSCLFCWLGAHCPTLSHPFDARMATWSI